jgi:hypothetical protein
MPKAIQVRNVPEGVHRELVRRARARGIPLSGLVRAILEREVARPSAEEVFDRIRRRRTVSIGRPVADFLRSRGRG